MTGPTTGAETEASSPPPGLLLSVLVCTGPALRTALLGGLLVAEGAIGTAFHLDAETQAILVEGAVLGSLLAVFLLPVMTHRFGAAYVAGGSAIATVLVLALGLAAAALGISPGPAATAGLLIGGLVAGFAVAVLAPVTQIMLNRRTEGNPRATHTLQSLWNAGQPAGFVVASLLTGVLIGPLGWSAALIVPLILAVIAMAALVLVRLRYPLPVKTDPLTSPDRTDVALIVVALIAFELWSTLGTLRGWVAPMTVVSLALTLVAGGFALNGLLKSPTPAMPVAPFRDVRFAVATLVLFLYQFATTAEFEVLLLADLAKMSPVDLGDRTAVGNIAQIAGTALAGVMMVRGATRLGLLAGMAITAIGLASYITYPWLDTLLYVTVTRSIVGFGAGLVTPILFTLALAGIGSRDQVAAGTWLVIATIAGTEVGLALLDIVLTAATTLGGSPRNGYIGVETVQFGIGLAVALAALALVAEMTLGVRSRSRSSPATASTGETSE